MLKYDKTNVFFEADGIFYLGVARAGKGFIAEAVIWAKIGLDPVSFSSYSVGDGP